MKIFRITQEKLAELGFIPNFNYHPHHHFNEHHVRAIFIGAFTICSEFVYIFEEADGVYDYMRSFFMAIAIIGIYISYVTTVFKTTELYNFIGNFQKLTNESK